MERRAEAAWTRRDFMGGAALLAMALGVPVAALRLSDLDPAEAPSDRQRAMVRAVSGIVLPRTGTAGADEVGVGEFVILALAHGLEGTRKPVDAAARPELAPFLRGGDGSLRHLDWLMHTLDRSAGGDFLALSRARQAELVATLDAQGYADAAPGHPWLPVKALVLDGYYTSEEGGARELRYVHVPGRFDPDLPLRPDDRAWSSDWSAVDFG